MMTDPREQPDRPAENVVAFKRRVQSPPRPQSTPTDQNDEDRARNRTNVAVLVLAAILVFLGWLLVHKLGQSANMQDCLMSGRINCAPIASPVRN